MENLKRLIEEISYVESIKKPCAKKYDIPESLSKDAKIELAKIDNEHNHSLAIDIFNENAKNLESVALQYRGNNISYRTMFEKAYVYAKALKEQGFGKGSQIPICVTNIPEFIYLFLAASFIGVKVNVVADWFNREYLTEIFNQTGSNTIFVDDMSYASIKDSIEKTNVKNIVMFSLTDSFPKNKDGESYNPFEQFEKQFHTITNRIDEYRDGSALPILSADDFVSLGANYTGKVLENVDLNDEFTITYTSGTTSPGRPKGVKHSVRTYISLGKNFKLKVFSNPFMKKTKFLGHIATDTHIALSCGIGNILYAGCTYDCEPFYFREFFPYSLLINKSNSVTASAGFWVYLCKLLNLNPRWKNVTLPNLFALTITGESCSPGEEKYINYTSRKHKFGLEKLPFPIPCSIGGGTTEGTGILVTLLKAAQEKLPANVGNKEGLGLTPLSFSEVEVLNSNLDFCKVGEPGLLIEKSPCEMIGYVDESLNKGTRIVDKNGKEWLSLGTFSYKSDKFGRVKMKGRMKDVISLSDGRIFPIYNIDDCILKDTKGVMSCSTVKIDDGYVCHVELLPNTRKSYDSIMKGIIGRIRDDVPEEIQEMLYIRMRDIVESYPLDPSGKRSLSTLAAAGVDEKCESFRELEEKYMNVSSKDNQHKLVKMQQF